MATYTASLGSSLTHLRHSFGVSKVRFGWSHSSLRFNIEMSLAAGDCAVLGMGLSLFCSAEDF